MGLLGQVRAAVMRRNSYFLAVIVGGAFVGELALDTAVNAAWEWNNYGVCESDGPDCVEAVETH